MTEIKPAGLRVPSSIKSIVILSALLGLVLFSGINARAAWTPRVAVQPPTKGTGGALTVNDRVVVRLRLPAGDVSASERLREAATRIELQLRLFPGKLTIEATRRTPGKDSVVSLNGIPVLTATEADGQEQGGSSLKLAQRWASQLRAAASLPALRFLATQIIVPIGESRTVTLKGVARGPLQIASVTDAAYTASPVEDSAPNDGTVQVRLTGRTAGTQQLIVERDGATASLDVIVQPWAGFINAPAPVILTGASIDSFTQRGLAEASVRNAIRLTPGASLRLPEDVSSDPRDNKQIAVSRKTISIPVEITGSNMIARKADVRVFVNAAATPTALPATMLLYSNDPEGITRPQTLFTAQLGERSKGATRLLYHHQSRLSINALFLVDLVNDNEAPARLHLRGGLAGPVVDTVWAGYRAGDAFLQALSDGSGYYLDFPAHSRIRIAATRMPAGQTISGIQELVQTSGQPLQVHIAAVAESDEERRTPLFTPELLPADINIAGQVATIAPSAQPAPSAARFPTPHMTLRNEYRVGERWDFVTIGHGHTNSTTANLIGAYGYMYDIEWNLINPTNKAALVKISFTPTAGLASGVFWIDGQTVERVPQAREQQEIQLYRIQLKPGEQKKVRLRTMPLAGSNYPARLVVHP
jgi:hypothetical protein